MNLFQGILIISLVLIVTYLYFIGVFSKIRIKRSYIGPLTLVYEKHRGDYAKSGEIQNKLYYSLKKDGILTYKGFGIYFDNPNKVEKEKLRSEVGCIIETKDIDKLQHLDYNVKIINKKKRYYADFPFRSKISIMIGILKVYPKINNFIDKNGLKHGYVMEIYDIPEKQIRYIILEDIYQF